MDLLRAHPAPEPEMHSTVDIHESMHAAPQWQDELSSYLEQSFELRGTDIIKWWSGLGHGFPLVQRVVVDIPATTSTLTPCERAFSKGRQVIYEFLHYLEPKTTEIVALLQSWYELA